MSEAEYTISVKVNGPAAAGSIREAVTEAVAACIEEAVKPKDAVGPRFSIGDVVSLKSGGPRMTVEGVYREEDGTTTAHCSWFARLPHDPAFDKWDDSGVRYASTASHGVFAIDGLERV